MFRSNTFSDQLPGNYYGQLKNLYGCVSVPSTVVVDPQLPDYDSNIFNTKATCNDFKYAVTGKLHDKLCYMIKLGKMFNVMPGMFFYYTLIQAPAASFTIDVVQSVSISCFQIFSCQKDVRGLGIP